MCEAYKTKIQTFSVEKIVKMWHIKRKIVIFLPILQVYSGLSPPPSLVKNLNLSYLLFPLFQKKSEIDLLPPPSVADIICERPLMRLLEQPQLHRVCKLSSSRTKIIHPYVLCMFFRFVLQSQGVFIQTTTFNHSLKVPSCKTILVSKVIILVLKISKI